jgi:hypothetical protein
MWVMDIAKVAGVSMRMACWWPRVLVLTLAFAGPLRAGAPAGERILTFRTAGAPTDPLLEKLAHQVASADIWLARMRRMGQRPSRLPVAAPELAGAGEAPVGPRSPAEPSRRAFSARLRALASDEDVPAPRARSRSLGARIPTLQAPDPGPTAEEPRARFDAIVQNLEETLDREPVTRRQ